MVDASNRSSCRLALDTYEALLDGSPDDLRALADLLERDDEIIVVELAGEGSPAVHRRRTTDKRLTVTATPGPLITISGAAAALDLLISPMRDVADEADRIRSAPVRRHAHIEYLGETDLWRSPHSFPLVITSDWPK